MNPVGKVLARETVDDFVHELGTRLDAANAQLMARVNLCISLDQEHVQAVHNAVTGYLIGQQLLPEGTTPGSLELLGVGALNKKKPDTLYGLIDHELLSTNGTFALSTHEFNQVSFTLTTWPDSIERSDGLYGTIQKLPHNGQYHVMVYNAADKVAKVALEHRKHFGHLADLQNIGHTLLERY